MKDISSLVYDIEVFFSKVALEGSFVEVVGPEEELKERNESRLTGPKLLGPKKYDPKVAA